MASIPIQFLDVADVLEIHADQLQNYGGSPGVRDQGLLESAVMQPQSEFDGKLLHSDVAAMAAAYIYHLALNHPFMDGNKRTSLATGLTFLYLNGYTLKNDLDDIQIDGQTTLEKIVLRLVKHEISKTQLASWINSQLEVLE